MEFFNQYSVAWLIGLALALLATIITTSIMSARAHRRRGSLDLGLLKKLMPSVVVGVLAGSVASGFLSGCVLTAVFAVMALLVATNMTFRRDGLSLGEGLPGPLGTSLIGGVIGGVSTLMGIGGGTLNVPNRVAKEVTGWKHGFLVRG